MCPAPSCLQVYRAKCLDKFGHSHIERIITNPAFRLFDRGPNAVDFFDFRLSGRRYYTPKVMG